MIMDWLGLVASLAGSLGTSALNYDVNERHRREDRDFAMQMAQYQNDVGMQNWRMQAGYNSPASQMQRFREAGLNPDLAYGQMHSEVPLQAGAGQGLSQGSQYHVDPMVVANTRLANAQAKSIEHDTTRQDEKQPYEVRQLQSTIDNLNKDLEVKSSQISSMSVDDQLKFAQIADYEFSHVMQDKEFQLEFERNAAEINKINSEINLNLQTYDEMVKTAAARSLGYDLNNELIRKQIGLTQKQIEQADENLRLLGYQVEAGAIENQIIIDEQNAFQRSAAFRAYNRFLRGVSKVTSAVHINLGIK